MIELAARALLTIGALMAVGSLLMLRITVDGSAEQAISQVSLIIGVVALAVAGLALWLTRRQSRADRPTEPHPHPSSPE